MFAFTIGGHLWLLCSKREKIVWSGTTTADIAIGEAERGGRQEECSQSQII